MKNKDRIRLKLQTRIAEYKRALVNTPYQETMTTEIEDLILQDFKQKELHIRIDELEQTMLELETL